MIEKDKMLHSNSKRKINRKDAINISKKSFLVRRILDAFRLAPMKKESILDVMASSKLIKITCGSLCFFLFLVLVFFCCNRFFSVLKYGYRSKDYVF